jgi:hypothetical protein
MSMGDISMRSPQLTKKKMDFGSGVANEYVWIYT